MLAIPSAIAQVAVIALGGMAGVLFLPAEAAPGEAELPLHVSGRAGGFLLVLFVLLLIGLPLLAAAIPTQSIRLADAFYRAGSLVFGGGHVVLPLLQTDVVPQGWVGNDAFLAGYGAAQAVPGPLFTFAAYLGAVMAVPPNGREGALLCLVMIFLPSFLLVIGALPFWEELRRRSGMRAALAGVNAAVVGLLIAAFYDPIWSVGITDAADFALASAAFLLLFIWQTPPWAVVILCALCGGLIGAFSG